MCWAERCCYVVPAYLGCVFVGGCSFIISAFMMATSITLFVLEAQEDAQLTKSAVAAILGSHANIPSNNAIFIIIIIMSVLWMVFSVMLIIGVVRNKSSFILGYFSFGVIVTIGGQLSALLLLLNNCWITATVFFIASLIHIHFLVVVHTVYELMQRGKIFSFRQHDRDQDTLSDCFDADIDNI